MKRLALDVYTEMFQEIWDLPEVQKSKEFLDGMSLTEVVKHALERQYLLGTLSEDFDVIKKDRDEDT